MSKPKRIILGSGKIYHAEFTGTLPSIASLVTVDKMLGAVSGGASLEYKPKYYTAKDDLGTVDKTKLIEEEAALKSGLMTLCGDTFTKICSTARISDDAATGKRTVKIGGLGKDNGKKYVILFLYDDPTDGQFGIMIVGQNQNGFTLSFKKEKETVLDVEFKASSMDEEGTLVHLIEDMVSPEALTVTLAKGSTTGKTKIETVLPELIDGDSLKYQIGTLAIAVTYDQLCTTGWTAAVAGTTEVAVTAGQVITVVEVDASNKAKRSGAVTVVNNIG